MKILLASDGSKYALRAARYLANHLGMFGVKPELSVIHVQPPVPSRAASVVPRSTLDRYYRDEGRKAIRPVERILKARGIEHEAVRLVGDPARSIAAYASRKGYSMIIMGSHGQGALSSFVLGSVVRKVLADCTVPVLVVR